MYHLDNLHCSSMVGYYYLLLFTHVNYKKVTEMVESNQGMIIVMMSSHDTSDVRSCIMSSSDRN